MSDVEILPDVSAMDSRQSGWLPKRIQGIRSVQADEAPPITRLDGEVTRQATSFAKGRYCEVWVGEWVNGGGEKVKVEKTSLNLTTSTLLTGLFVGGPESTSNRVIGGGT